MLRILTRAGNTPNEPFETCGVYVCAKTEKQDNNSRLKKNIFLITSDLMMLSNLDAQKKIHLNLPD